MRSTAFRRTIRTRRFSGSGSKRAGSWSTTSSIRPTSTPWWRALDGLWDAPGAGAAPGAARPARRAGRAAAHRVARRAARPRAGAPRADARACSDWRIHGFHYLNPAARRLFDSPRLMALVSRLFGRPARPFAVINFMKGSRQHLHQDMAVFHIHPWNYLIGAWIACEDIRPDSGPLVFYPGSHRAPFFPGFTDYPQTNLRTADEAHGRRLRPLRRRGGGRLSRGRSSCRARGRCCSGTACCVHGGAPVVTAGDVAQVDGHPLHGARRRSGQGIQGPVRW